MSNTFSIIRLRPSDLFSEQPTGFMMESFTISHADESPRVNAGNGGTTLA